MNIIITGASKGLGRAIAEKFAANGYDLYLCARHEDALHETADAIRKNFADVNVKVRACDVSSKNDIISFADWILADNNSPDILVNNAGSFISGHVHNEPEGALEKPMETNVYSAYHLTRRILPAMIRKRSGHIFNMCSIASLKAYEHGGAYSITKYALAGFSKNLRDEMKRHNTKVTSLFPGAAYTASWDSSGVDPDRIMTAADIAEMVFISSRLSPQACVEEIVIRPQLGDL